MFGKPKDVEGECNAHLYLADDHGDNTCTIRCNLAYWHTGDHRELCGERCVIYWREDERDYNIYEKCEKCDGIGVLYTDDDCKRCDGQGRIVVGRLPNAGR